MPSEQTELTAAPEDTSNPPSILSGLKARWRTSTVPDIIIIAIIAILGSVVIGRNLYNSEVGNLASLLSYFAELGSDVLLQELVHAAKRKSIFWIASGMTLFALGFTLLQLGFIILADFPYQVLRKFCWQKDRFSWQTLGTLNEQFIRAFGSPIRTYITLVLPGLSGGCVTLFFHFFLELPVWLKILPVILGFSATLALIEFCLRKTARGLPLTTKQIRKLKRWHALISLTYIVSLSILIPLYILLISFLINGVITPFSIYSIRAWIPAISRLSIFLESTQVQMLQELLQHTLSQAGLNMGFNELGEGTNAKLIMWLGVASIAGLVYIFPITFVTSSHLRKIGLSTLIGVIIFGVAQTTSVLLTLDLPISQPIITGFIGAGFATLAIYLLDNLLREPKE